MSEADLDARLERIEDARAAGDHAGALRLVEDSLREAPEDAWAFHFLGGQVLLDLRRHREAVAAFERSVASNADFRSAWNGLGEARYEVGDLDGSLDAVLRGLAIERTPLGLERAVFVLRKLGRIEEAIDMGLEFLTHEPRHARMLTRVGIWCGYRGRDEEARSLYVRALDADPDYARAHAELGFLEFWRGDVNDALEILNRAIESGPDCAPAHFYLAYSLRRIGAMKSASEAYRTAVSLNPDIHSDWADAEFLGDE